jgi:hypothetical protein
MPGGRCVALAIIVRLKHCKPEDIGKMKSESNNRLLELPRVLALAVIDLRCMVGVAAREPRRPCLSVLS